MIPMACEQMTEIMNHPWPMWDDVVKRNKNKTKQKDRNKYEKKKKNPPTITLSTFLHNYIRSFTNSKIDLRKIIIK